MNERNLKSWKPGQSGNLLGRRLKSPEERTAEALAREHTPEAIAALAGIAKSSRANTRARVAAAEALLDRGWGRATETRNVNIKRPIIELSDAELVAIIAGGGDRDADSPECAPEPESFH